MSFVFAPAATYMVSLSRKNCNNIKNHLAILCLDFLRSNLRVKFAKFGFKFYAPRPVLRKRKFKNAQRDSAKFNLHAVQQPLTCSGVGGGFCLAKLAAASRRERVCFWQLRVRSTTQRKATLRK